MSDWKSLFLTVGTPITQVVLLCMGLLDAMILSHCAYNVFGIKRKVTEQLAIYLLVYDTLPGGATSYGISVR
jgi:hypothetical protein